jgi:DNA-binding MarR family transcriptional regulator
MLADTRSGYWSGLESKAQLDMTKRSKLADLHTPPEVLFAYEFRATSLLLANALKQHVVPHGITLTQYFLLRHVWDEEGINQSELSERLATTQPATVATVDVLEKRGLIKRVRGTDDRRVVRLFLTPKGRTMRTALLRSGYSVAVQALDGMSAVEVKRLREALGRVRANLELQFSGAAAERGT